MHPRSTRSGGLFGVVRRNPEFRRLWLSQVVSQVGDWLNRTAVLALIGELTGPEQALEIGLLFGVEIMLRLMPTALLSPIAGPIADRLPRRALMIWSDLLRAGIVLLLVTIDQAEELPLLYALVALQMGVSIFFDAARSASVPNTVPRDELLDAQALSAATWSAMLAVEAALGGGLLAIMGTRGVFFMDAATFCLSALLLVGIRLPRPVRGEQVRWWKMPARDLRLAMAHVRERGLVGAMVVKASWGMAGGFLAMLSVLGTERFGADPSSASDEAMGHTGLAIGLLYAARGLGTGIGPFLARRVFGADERGLWRGIVAGFFVAAGGYALVPFAETLPAALFWVVVAHLGGSAIWVASTVLWQRGADDGFRGRVHSLEMLLMTLSFSVWAAAIGLVRDAFESVDVAIWTGAIAAALVGTAWAGLRSRVQA